MGPPIWARGIGEFIHWIPLIIKEPFLGKVIRPKRPPENNPILPWRKGKVWREPKAWGFYFFPGKGREPLGPGGT